MRNIIFLVLILYIFSACHTTKDKTVYYADKISDTTFFKDWLLLGPFPNSSDTDRDTFVHGDKCEGFFKDYLKSSGGEKECSPAEGDAALYEKLNIKRSWRFYHSPSNRVLLKQLYPKSVQIISYAFCKIISPDKRKMILSIGSNDGIRVFLNGEMIHSAHPENGRRITEDEDLVPIELKNGENRLLLKIENGFGGYGFILRLLRPDSPLLEKIKMRGKALTLSDGDIKTVFIDNYPFGKDHLAGYNGIAELYHTAQDSNLFVPHYAGFNLEHIFGGDSLPVIFEPRQYSMDLKKISANEVELHQSATILSHCESWTSFKLVKPHYVDIRFRCVIHSPEFFKHGYAGLFWASYINAPQDKKIYFLTRENGKSKWVGAFSPGHGKNSTYLAVNDNNNFFMADNFNVVLAKSFSRHRFIKPFYYGRYKYMVFAYFFSTSGKEVIRFSQSPNGGGEKNPAWDFQFIIPHLEIGKMYEFSARLMYKKYVSRQDVLNEYENWEKGNK